MRVILELHRIIIIIAVLATILGYIPHFIYSELGINTDQYGWASMIGVRMTRLLIISAIILLLSPPMLDFLLN